MSSDERHGSDINDRALRETANSSPETVRISSLSPKAMRGLASQVFAQGIHSYGKAMQFAERMQVQTSVISEIKNGKRIVPYHLMLALLEDRDAAFTILGRECELAGFPAPQLKNEIELSAGEARLLNRLRVSGLWQFVGRWVAREVYGCSEELLEVALELHERK